MATTTATVTTITAVSLFGIRLSVASRMLCQSKVPTETRTITATRAAIGITATTRPSATTSTSRKVPARNVESHPGDTRRPPPGHPTGPSCGRRVQVPQTKEHM